MSVWLSMSVARDFFKRSACSSLHYTVEKMIVMNYRNYQNNSLSMESEN